MSLFNQLIPNYVLNDKRQIRVAPQMPEPVYIDDAFDPLFNKRAQDYLTAKYGRFLRIPGGYAEMFENMLGNSTKQWGPLGPGMGILGTFGRTIDKAEDFLLGGITEATKLGTNLNPLGHYEPLNNPLREVFVEDKDYTGQKLLAAMTNNMSKLAGDTALTENDFRGMWNVPSLGIEIATDPGILGGSLSRHLVKQPVTLVDDGGNILQTSLHQAAQNGAVSSKDLMDMISKETNIKSAVGEAGQLMSNFDDFLARASWDVTAPGLRPLIKNNMQKIRNILGSESYRNYVNVKNTIGNPTEEVVKPSVANPVKAATETSSETPLDKLSKEIKAKKVQVTLQQETFEKDMKTLFDKVKRGELPDDAVLSSIEQQLMTFKTYLINSHKRGVNKAGLKTLPEDLIKAGNNPERFAEAVKEADTELLSEINLTLRDIRAIREFKSKTDFADAIDNLSSNFLGDKRRTLIDRERLVEQLNNLPKADNAKMEKYNTEVLAHYKAHPEDFAKTEEKNFASLPDSDKFDVIDSMKDTDEYLPNEYKNDDGTFDYMGEYEGYEDNKFNLQESLEEAKEYAIDEMSKKYPEFDGDAIDLEDFYFNEDVKKYEKETKEIAYRRLNEITNWDTYQGNSLLNYLKNEYSETPVYFVPNRARNILRVMQETQFLPATSKYMEDELTKIVDEAENYVIKAVNKSSDEQIQQLVDLFGVNNLNDLRKKLFDVDRFIQNFKYGNTIGMAKVFEDSMILQPAIRNYDEINGIAAKDGVFPFYVKTKGKKDLVTFYGDFKNFVDAVTPSKIEKEGRNVKIKLEDFPENSHFLENNSVDNYVTSPEKSLAANFNEADSDIKFGPFSSLQGKVFNVFDNVQDYLKDIDTGIGQEMTYGSNSHSIAAGLRENLKNLSRFDNIDLFRNPDGSINYKFINELRQNYPTIDFKFKGAYKDHEKIMNTFFPNQKQFEYQFSKDYPTVSNFFGMFENDKQLSRYFGIETKNVKRDLKYLNEHLPEINDAISEMSPGQISFLYEYGGQHPQAVKGVQEVAQATGQTPQKVVKKIKEVEHYNGPHTQEVEFYTKVANTFDDVQVKNVNKDTAAIVNLPFIKKDLTQIDKLMESVDAQILKEIKHPEKLTEEALNAIKIKKRREFGAKLLEFRDAVKGDVIKKENVIDELTNSGGLIGLYEVGKAPETLAESVKHNAEILNRFGNIVTPVNQKVIFKGNKGYFTRECIGLIYNTVPGVEPIWQKTFKNLNPEELSEMIFELPRHLDVPKGYEKFNDLFNSIGENSANLHKTFGELNVSNLNTKHSYVGSQKAAGFEGALYNQIGLKRDEANTLSNVLQQMRNVKGPFMTFPMARSLRGNISNWNVTSNVFETDLSRVAKSTFTEGIFENKKLQDYTSLFLNGNTKVDSWTNSADGLWNTIHAKDAFGKDSGNLTNMVLVNPVYNENGTIVRFKKYDMSSRKAVEEAYANGAYYMPTTLFAPFDRMIKKDAKMSNKFYAFMNKYLILPFKFGALANPGFLVGNFSDAYMKQAITLAQKHGTSVADEFAGVTQALYDIHRLNDGFDKVYRTKFLQSLSKQEIESNPLIKVTSNCFEVPEFNNKFNKWYLDNKALLPKQEQNLVDITLYINKYLPTMSGNLTAFDLEDVGKVLKGGKYEVPKSRVEKLFMGHNYDPKNITTWGVNANPYSSGIYNKSGSIETNFRSGAFVNDLRRYYKNDDEFAKAINVDPKLHKQEYELLKVRSAEALNLMNAANFNYDNISEFMQKTSYLMPFPTFYLKNLGYWLEVLEEHPEYIDTITNAQNTMWHGIDTSKDNFQAEAKGRGSLPMSSIIGQKPSKVFKGVLKPTMTNSMFSAFSTVNNPMKDLAHRLNPALSPITRHLEDPENVKYRPYSTDPYEKNIKQGDKNFSKLTYTFHKLNPYDRFLNTYLRTPAKVRTKQAQMSDFLPSIFQPDYSRKETIKK